MDLLAYDVCQRRFLFNHQHRHSISLDRICVRFWSFYAYKYGILFQKLFCLNVKKIIEYSNLQEQVEIIDFSKERFLDRYSRFKRGNVWVVNTFFPYFHSLKLHGARASIYLTWEYWIKKKVCIDMNNEYVPWKIGPKIHENLKCAVTSLTSLEKEVLLISWRDNDDAAPAVPDCLSKCGQILSGIAKWELWELLMPSWFHQIIFLIFKIPKNSALQNISCTKANLIYHAPNFVLDKPFFTHFLLQSGSTETFCNFANVSYFWECFFSYFQEQNKYKNWEPYNFALKCTFLKKWVAKGLTNTKTMINTTS